MNIAQPSSLRTNIVNELVPEPEQVGNPDLHVPYTGTTEAYVAPPPPPEGYTLDQWILERKIRSENSLARAQEKLAEEMREKRRGIDPDLDYDISTPRATADFSYQPDDKHDFLFWLIVWIIGLAVICGGLALAIVIFGL